MGRSARQHGIVHHAERAAHFYQPRPPDGRRLALVASGDDDVWVYDVAQRSWRFTSGSKPRHARWTPDGKRITFNRTGSLQTLLQSADRSGPEEVILEGEPSQIPHCWSPDGRLLFFTVSSSKTGSDIWTLSIEDRKKQPVVVSPFNDGTPAISPSGQLLAYTSDESGRAEVYVQLFPGGGGRQQISREGGTEPLWARNGKELFFRQGARLMAVAIGAGTSFGSPHLLFDAPWMTNTSSRTNYDVSLDGQRFVAVRTIEPGSVPRIHVVLNWADELKRQVPK
jgi:serine/threonine-protein kinase